MFEIFEPTPSIVPTPFQTKAHLKSMMKHKGKTMMEEANSPTKVPRKRTSVEGKEVHKML
jgi:hypothetical protein